MIENYELCFNWTQQQETSPPGMYENVPGDHGGPTRWGITLAELQRWRHAPCSADDVKGLQLEEAMAIGKVHYWDSMLLDSVPSGVDLMLFDFGFNTGSYRSVKTLQQAVMAHGLSRAEVPPSLNITQDGIMGPHTLQATRSYINNLGVAGLLATLCYLQESFYRGLSPSQFQEFGNGWMLRTKARYAMAKQMGASPLLRS